MSEHSTISLEQTLKVTCTLLERCSVYSYNHSAYYKQVISHRKQPFALYNENLNVQAEGNIRESE
jgi:hypothetical protein